MQLGDASSGKLADNITAFGRTLRRAGVACDPARIALAQSAAQLAGLARRDDLAAALEAVLVGREADRAVFRELFDAFFQDPKIANKLLAQMLPSTQARPDTARRRPRVREALAPPKPPAAASPKPEEDKVELDAAMTMSDAMRLRHADFNALGAAEFAHVERLAREIALPLPTVPSRRTHASERGTRPHWPHALQKAARTGGELLVLPRRQRRDEPLPLLVLVDVSGSMERYARLLLAFLHAATRTHAKRDVFAFGAQLTDLTPAFQLADSDAMLAAAGRLICDFGAGTKLGESLATLRREQARRLVGRRTLVLVISDGLDTGEPAQLADQLHWLKRHSRRILWLNPLLRFDGYAPIARGAAVLHRAVDGMLAVHDLSRLEQLASGLARLIGR